MGGGLARSLARNHEILTGSRDPERARAKAGELAAAGAGSYRDVAEQAELLLFTIPWWGVDEALSELGESRRQDPHRYDESVHRRQLLRAACAVMTRRRSASWPGWQERSAMTRSTPGR